MSRTYRDFPRWSDQDIDADEEFLTRWQRDHHNARSTLHEYAGGRVYLGRSGRGWPEYITGDQRKWHKRATHKYDRRKAQYLVVEALDEVNQTD